MYCGPEAKGGAAHGGVATLVSRLIRALRDRYGERIASSLDRSPPGKNGAKGGPPAVTQISVAPPLELTLAISRLLEGRPRKALTERAQRLSEGFRAQRPSYETVRHPDDALAYAICRMPATYAATATALAKVRDEIPQFEPKTLLDLGCGLGGAAYSALEAWPELESVTMLDHSCEFLALARQILPASSRAALAKAQIVAAEMDALPEDAGPFDLVVMSYSATELAEPRLLPTVKAAWRSCAGALVIIEPGTPRDHRRLLAMRTALAQAGASIALPCPHAEPCPLKTPDWCHFSARLPRRRDHKLLKDATVPFEDEKFSYLVAARDGLALTPNFARILRLPRILKYGLELKLCASTGIREIATPKRNKARYDEIRKSSWGDRIAATPEDRS
jgi:ribosomal protein RSM22 (predicted rRNA methylase)